MFRTLQQLKESVDKLIEQQGSDAPCYSIIMTANDVVYYDMDNNQIPHDKVDAERVFEDMTESGYLLQEVNDTIDETIKHLGLGKVTFD